MSFNTMSVCVECRGVTRTWNGREVLRGINWRLPAGTVAGLVGSSGAGKTTLLRIIAGLDRPTSGQVSLQSESNKSGAARIGMVFQNLGLWPHLTALGHVQCVLRSQARDVAQKRVKEILAEVHLPEAAWQLCPAQLSGGEAQRLALARALASNPQLLLLDEPLAQLDSPLRSELLELIRQVAAERTMTVIYVTHAGAEIAELCQQIAVLVDGQMMQTGPFDEVFFHPTSLTVARLTGPVVELPLQLFEQGQIAHETEPLVENLVEQDRILVRPQQLCAISAAGLNTWRVESCRPDGAVWSLVLTNDNHSLRLFTGDRRSPGESIGLICRPPEDESALGINVS